MVDTLLLRADASTRMGTGHIMRCLALAQAWQEGGGRAAFAVASCPPALSERLIAEGLEAFVLSSSPGSSEDACETGLLARQLAARWIVADGYEFGTDYQRALKETDVRLLVIDDYGHADHYSADIVLNQNLGARPDLYASREPTTQLLLGGQYVMLRREFWRWRGWRREVAEVARRVLVTFGGSDPDNVTLKAAQALARVAASGLEVKIAIGASNPHYEKLQGHFGDGEFELARNVKDITELMKWADAAITAGGATCLELAFMGVPSVVMILADNQRAIAEPLGVEGIAVNLGWHAGVSEDDITQAAETLLASAEHRAEVARRAQALVDGNGGFRVCQHVRSNS